MGWMILLALVGACLMVVLFVLLTDGRYFGKRLMHWVYDHVGPAVFAARSETETWHTLFDSIGLEGDESVLDVGTAAGDLPLSLASMPGFRGRVVGVDWSPRMIRLAQEEAMRRGLEDCVRFDVVDVRKGLPFATGQFDVLICLGLLETLPQPDDVLQAFKRVLSKDGVLVLSLYRGWTSSVAALSLAWYKEHLSPLGLDDLRVVPCRRHHDAVIARPARKDHSGAR